MLAPLSFLVGAASALAHSPHTHRVESIPLQYTVRNANDHYSLLALSVCLCTPSPACLLDCQSRGQSSPASRSSAHARYQHTSKHTPPKQPSVPDHSLTHSPTTLSLFLLHQTTYTHDTNLPENHSSLLRSPLFIARSRQIPTPTRRINQSITRPLVLGFVVTTPL